MCLRLTDAHVNGHGWGWTWTHSPNFKGAAEAAERLAAIPEFQNAKVVKSNPDTPQSMVQWDEKSWIFWVGLWGMCIYACRG